ncbi:MAG: IMP dehydrogenase, partial [Nitrosarchaeum sp.]|nr:IMP dehydrogenase [Nitrosarchaeum sp.]
MRPDALQKALGFDDLGILPADRSNIASRKEVDTSTKLSRNITLQYPIVVSPMDTISDVEMCIAVNSIGAAAILHRFMPIKEQSEKAYDIKRKTGRSYAAVGLQDYRERVPSL